ncbi:MAG: YopX family protein [Promethearchaeota archaeon]|jgi:uncharacterized phage protein (TIGR01671 family)
MRQIKFRAWDKKSCKIHYFDFSGKTIFAYEGEVCGIILPDTQTTLMYNEIGLNENLELMQFTGLKDKNGKEVFESDVVRFYIEGEEYTSKVFFDMGAYCVKVDDDWEPCLYEANSMEVIGNIWENKELLK